jgi:hypothetical protein
MYQDQLFREARLIIQGQQEFVRDAAALWRRLMARLGVKAAKAPAADARRR